MLFACVTPNAYNLKLNSLIGASKNDIETQFGKPSAIKILGDNTEILAYTNVDNVFVPSEFYTYSQGEEIYGEDGLLILDMKQNIFVKHCFYSKTTKL